jgi:hypothetical protein
MDELAKNGHREMGLPHAAWSDEQEADFLDRVIFRKLLGYFEGVAEGIVHGVEILERAIPVALGNLRPLDERPGLFIQKATAALGQGSSPGFLNNPAGVLTYRARIVGLQFK